MRLAVRQGERDALPGSDGELGNGGELLATKLHAAVQNHDVRPGDGTQAHPVLQSGHPWHRGAVLEAQREIEPHRDLAAAPLDDAHHGRLTCGRGHEVDQRDAAILRIEDRLQDQRAGPVVSISADRRLSRSNAPAPVVRRAHKRGEAGTTVETGPAQPVDGALATDQRGGMTIANQCIVFNSRRMVRFGGGRRIARIVLRSLGRACPWMNGRHVARPHIRPWAVVQ